MIKLNNTTYKNIAKDNPKDLVEIEYGDSKDLTKFQPQQKVQRWDNECNVSLRLIEDATELREKATIIEENGKIKHIKSKRECHFYNLGVSAEHPEDAQEFEIILKEDPRKNKKGDYDVEFSIEDKDVDYFYQPALTPEEIAEGASRPENVIGSYAVYAKTPKANYMSKEQSDLNKISDELTKRNGIPFGSTEMAVGEYTNKTDLELTTEKAVLQDFVDKDTRVFKEYKCGKIGHIFRPKLLTRQERKFGVNYILKMEYSP